MRKADFIPPIVLRLLRKSIKFREFQSFESAFEACVVDGDGYELEDLVSTVSQKTKNFQTILSDTLPTLLDLNSARSLMTAVAFKSNEENKVLDLGGAAGIHYFLTKKAFDADTTFKWCVVETNKMVFENKGSENSELTFRTSIEEAKKLLESIDLIHVSGSIQYFSDPIQVLRQLVKLDSTWIIFFRTPLSESKTRIVKQSSKIGDNGPGHLENRNKNKIVSYPVTFVSRKLFEEIVSEYYEILYYFKENEYSNVNGELIELFGYVCKKLKNGVRRD